MTGPAADGSPADPSVPLADVRRGDLIESRHRGQLGVYDPSGAVLLERGDLHAVTYPRSSIKPVQAVGLLRHGAPLSGGHLAIAAASHSGEDIHVATVLEILTAAGLDATALQCPAALPTAGGVVEPSRIRMNCSGKHAGMLLAAVHAGEDPDRYLDADQPVQQRLRATIEDLTATTISVRTVDGCGAPLFGFPLHGLARALRTLVLAAPGSRERAVADAMRAHPYLVGGRDRHVTILMQSIPGLLMKDGAEGVTAAALPDGHAVVVKIADGGPRAKTAVLLAGLARAGADLSAVPAELRFPPVLGGEQTVGAVHVVI